MNKVGLRLTSPQSNVIGAGCSCERHSSIFAISGELAVSCRKARSNCLCAKSAQSISNIMACNAHREVNSNPHIRKHTEGVRRCHVAESAVAMAARRSRFFNNSGVERFIWKLCIRGSVNIAQLCTPRDQQRRLYECFPASSSLSAWHQSYQRITCEPHATAARAASAAMRATA